MKNSKSILNWNFIFCMLVQVLVIVAIAMPMPPMEQARLQAAEALRIQPGALWIPLLGILLLVDFIVLKRLHTSIANPLRHLVNQTKLGSSSFAFKKKSVNVEEDDLKHFIESQALKVAEMEQEVSRMELEVEKAIAVSRIGPKELEDLERKLEKANQTLEDQLNQLADADNAKTAVDRELESLRRDLKNSNRELESLKSENAKDRPDEIEAASLSSILVEKLKDPLTLINNLSWRLAKAWADTPMSQMREGLEEISKQSEEQLELLKKYRVAPPREEQERRAR